MGSGRWLLPPALPARRDGEVHVWRARLDAGVAERTALAATLSPSELERAARFRFPRLRHDFVVARGILRAVLGAYRDQDPAEVPLATTDRGKPFVAADHLLRFSLSHSGRLALLAVSGGREVGVDVEEVVAGVDHAALAERFFSRHEREALATVPDHLRRHAFFACWTRKEAFVKATGEGLHARLDGFDVSVHPAEPARLLAVAGDSSAASRWSMAALDAGAGYAAALAVEGELTELSLWQWSPAGATAVGLPCL